MSWPRQGSQNTLDNPELERKSWISWVWGFEVVHAKGSFEVALPPNAQPAVQPLQQGNESMYSNTSGYVHMVLTLDWGKGITGQ